MTSFDVNKRFGVEMKRNVSERLDLRYHIFTLSNNLSNISKKVRLLKQIELPVNLLILSCDFLNTKIKYAFDLFVKDSIHTQHEF